jgi:hypothetical protein
MKVAVTALVIFLAVLSACSSTNPYPKAPPGGPLVDGPFKDCVYSKGYGEALTMEQLEVNDRALAECEGVPFD